MISGSIPPFVDVDGTLIDAGAPLDRAPAVGGGDRTGPGGRDVCSGDALSLIRPASRCVRSRAEDDHRNVRLRPCATAQ